MKPADLHRSNENVLFRVYWQDGHYSGVAIVSANTAEDAKLMVRSRKPKANVFSSESFILQQGIVTLG